MKSVVPKLQETIMYVTRCDEQLEHCIVLTVPISPQNPFKCKLCYQEFPGIYALRQHRNTQHGMEIGSGTRNVDVEHIVGDVDDRSLREELRSCQHFLADSELERTRHKVFNCAVETLNETIVNEKLDHFSTI